MKAFWLEAAPADGASGNKQRKIINRPRSSHRANRRALGRRSLGRRQLQHSGVLTLAQLRNQGEVPIGKLKRVVMHGRLI
jgi:hypothetical protein